MVVLIDGGMSEGIWDSVNGVNGSQEAVTERSDNITDFVWCRYVIMLSENTTSPHVRMTTFYGGVDIVTHSVEH